MATRKDIFWSYSGYIFNLGFSLLLLPFTLKFLNPNELGLWYTYLSIGAFINLLDFGFMPTITRNFSYAFAGAIKLDKEGVSNEKNLGIPNKKLLDSLLHVTNKIYTRISLIALFILVFICSPYIYVINTSGFSFDIGLSWIFFVLGSFFNFLFSYWGSMLTAVGGIQQAQKSLIFSRVIQLTISILGLYNGFNLVAVTFSFFVSGFALRQLYRYFYFSIYKLRVIDSNEIKEYDNRKLYNIIWFNAKKQGVVSVAGFLIVHGNILITSSFINLETTSKLGITQQIIQIISGFSRNYFTAKIPFISQFIAKNDLKSTKKIVSKTAFVYWISFVLLVSGFVIFSDVLFALIKTEIQLLNGLPLLILILIVFLETNHSLFATIITLNNKIPFIKPALISGFVMIVLSLIGVVFFEFTILELLLIQFITQLAYNNWKWPIIVFNQYNLSIMNIIKENVIDLKNEFFYKNQ